MDMKDKIKLLRKQQGLTLEDVGRIVGVGKSTVRKWETGDIANMRRDKIALLAEALHTTPGYLMGWEGAEQATAHPVATLTPRDEKDIATKLERLMAQLEDAGDLMFDGNPMSDEAKESIKAAMKLGLEAAKLKNKERFTPKKYRKEP